MADPLSSDFLFILRKSALFAKHFSSGKEDFSGLFQEHRSYLELQTLLMDVGFRNYESDINGHNAHSRTRSDASIDLLIETDIRNVNRHGFTYLTLPNNEIVEQFFTDYHEWDLSRSRYQGLDALKKEDSHRLRQDASISPWTRAGGYAGVYTIMGGLLLYNQNTREVISQNWLINIPLFLIGLVGAAGLGYLYHSTSKRFSLREEVARCGKVYREIEENYTSQNENFQQSYLNHMVHGKQALELALTLPKKTS